MALDSNVAKVKFKSCVAGKIKKMTGCLWDVWDTQVYVQTFLEKEKDNWTFMMERLSCGQWNWNALILNLKEVFFFC